MYIYIYASSHRQMRITFGVIANHWPTDSQYIWVLGNHFWPIANHFCKWIRKKTFFLILTPFLGKFYAIRNKSVNKLQTTANQFKK